MDINGARLAYSTRTTPKLTHHPKGALDMLLKASHKAPSQAPLSQEPFVTPVQDDFLATDLDRDVNAKNYPRKRITKMPMRLAPTPDEQFRAEHYRQDTPKGPICHECGTDYPCRPIVLMDEIEAHRTPC